MIDQHAKAIIDALDAGESEESSRVILAACYGAQALDVAASRGITRDGAPIAMARAFLLALIDPLDPALDYLRSDPAAGEAARAKRKGGAA